MIKYMVMEVIALGKGEEDRAYREKVQKLFDKYGVSPTRVWRVNGRRMGQVMAEMGEAESAEAAQAVGTKLVADAEWIALQKERNEAGTVVPGTQEVFELHSY